MTAHLSDEQGHHQTCQAAQGKVQEASDLKKKNYRQLNKAKSGELVLPSKEHMNWLSIANLSALRTTK